MTTACDRRIAGVTGAARGFVQVGREVGATGQRWLAIQLDQRDMGALRQAASRVRREFGGLDILFANAGIQAIKPLLEMEDADWADQIGTNLTGSANVLRAFAPLPVERSGGRVIVIASTQGRRGFKYGASHSASQWGLFGLVKSAATEWGEYNITVNALVPGLIDTPMTRHEDRYAQVIVDAGQRPTGDEDRDEATAARIKTDGTPLGAPWIDPAAIAPAVVFLASDDARMATGASFDVTGGDSATCQ